jgi:hypothetical protein
LSSLTCKSLRRHKLNAAMFLRLPPHPHDSSSAWISSAISSRRSSGGGGGSEPHRNASRTCSGDDLRALSTPGGRTAVGNSAATGPVSVLVAGCPIGNVFDVSLLLAWSVLLLLLLPLVEVVTPEPGEERFEELLPF